MIAKNIDTPKPRRRRRPSPHQMRQEMAEAGDVNGLLQVLDQTNWTMFDHEETFRQLLRGIEVQSAQDPALFAQTIFSKMVGFTGYLVFRSHYYLSHLIRSADRRSETKGTPSLPREVTDVYLPRLMELQGHLAGLAHTQASTMRFWELTRQRKLENDQTEREGSKPRRRSPLSNPSEGPAGLSDGAELPVNRLAGLLGDLQ